MTSPEQARQTYGAREYVHPTTGEKYPAVSSITNHVRVFFDAWHRGLAATEAIERRGLYEQMDPRAAIDAVKAEAKWKSGEGARRGNAVHEAIDTYLGGDEPIFDEGLENRAEIVETFEQFVNLRHALDLDVVLNEVTVYNATHRYAGTLDALVRMPEHHGDGLVVLDWKTGKKVYPTTALQLTAYTHAEEITFGAPIQVRTMPEIVAAYAVHLTAKGWRIVPLDTSEATWAAFRALAYFANYWRSFESSMVGVPVATGKATAA